MILLADRLACKRVGICFLLLAAVVAAWAPHLLPVADRWLEARRIRTNIAILYTTDTRGFLDSCG